MLAALRRLVATAVGLLQTRIELIATELEEEGARLFRILVLAVAAGFFLALGVVALTFFAILLAWDNHRELAAGLLTAGYLGVGAILALGARNAAKKKTKLFSASLAELKKDREGLS